MVGEQVLLSVPAVNIVRRKEAAGWLSAATQPSWWPSSNRSRGLFRTRALIFPEARA
jgi:hypothetical protein